MLVCLCAVLRGRVGGGGREAGRSVKLWTSTENDKESKSRIFVGEGGGGARARGREGRGKRDGPGSESNTFHM